MNKWLGTVLLAGVLPMAAHASTWDFSYTNLQPDPDVVWTITSFSGSFTGLDRNLDGTISANELTALEIDFPAGSSVERDVIVPNATTCPQPTDECAGINAFSFDRNTQALSFDVWFQQWNAGFQIVSGAEIDYFAPVGNTHSTWTGDTSFAIERQRRFALAQALPVPEPATPWLLGAGLGLLALWQGRRAHGVRRLPPQA
jgi:hypothetical protein